MAETLKVSQGRLARACAVLQADPPRGLPLQEAGDWLGLVSGPECADTIERLTARCTNRPGEIAYPSAREPLHMGHIEDRLRALNIKLPVVPQPVANYVPARRFGNLAQTAGQISRLGEVDYRGKLGATLALEEGQKAPRACAINCLAALLTVVDSLDRVKQIVGVHGFVNSTLEFDGQAAVMNGASDLLVEVFGEAGRHTRTAVGVAALPLGYAASVYLVAEVD